MQCTIKKCLSLVLALVMIFSLVPVQAFAAEDAGHDHTEDSTIIAEPVITDPVRAIQSRIDSILTQYGITADMSETDIGNAIFANDVEAVLATMEEIPALENDAAALKEEEFASLQNLDAFGNFVGVLNSLTEVMSIKTVTVLDGKISVADTANSISASGNTVTATAKGSLFSKKTSTITITNDSGSTAAVSFDYTATAANKLTMNGATAAASGSFNGVLNAGDSVTFVLTSNSGLSGTTATLKLSNITLVTASASSNVTFEFDASYGSVTVDGAAVTSGTQKEISLSTGATAVAVPVSGATFLGWVDGDHRLVTTSTTYEVKPAEDMTVKAIFVGSGSPAYFGVGSAAQKNQSSGLLGLSKIYYYQVGYSYIYDDLNAAASAAASDAANKALVLLNSATLPAGTYTIPAGVTLLIPFDSSNTMYTTQAVSISYDKYSQPTAYRTLTLADGANLVLNGSLSVSAQHTWANGSRANGGSPTGPVSFVKMQGNSKITINNGGALYAYGYVTGSGSVVANSGAVVYENFQIMDFRGGTQSTDMDNGVFPLSQYYIQNIEVPLTLYSGATEYAYTTIYMSNSDFGSAVAFISKSNAMFNLSNGYVTKRYDGTKDRLVVEAHGDVEFASINMSIGTSSINSKNYELPVNSNLSVYADDCTISINQDIAMLPGSEMVVGENASCVLGKGINVYIYDADQWGDYTFGQGSVNTQLKPLTYAPGRTYDRTVADMVDAKIEINGYADASAGHVYTTAGGANVCGTGTLILKPGTQTVTHQLIQAGFDSTGASVAATYVEIPLVPAMLKNEDGTYLETASKPYATYTFADGKWNGQCHHVLTEAVTTPATCTSNGVKTFSCSCGYSYTETITSTGHDYKSVVTAPTCTADGFTTYTCAKCADSYVSDYVTSAGHNPVTDDAVAPSCEETGLTEGSHCSVCGKTLVAQQVVDATGHTLGEDANCTDAQTCITCGAELEAALGHAYKSVIVAPNCSEQGYTNYTCSRCGDNYKSDYVAALGHNPVTDDAVAPSCEETGLTEGSHCSVCGETLVAQDTVDALGHDAVIDDAVAPSCEESGLTEGSHCSVCGKTLVAQDTVDALGHTPVTDDAVAPNCTDTGLTEGSHCSVCGKTLVAQDTVDALGHSPVTDDAVAPNCTDTGLTEGSHCSVCGETLVAQEPIDALGHLMSDATCTAPATCMRGCGHTDGTALGHDLVEEEEFPATCTTDGHSAGKYCTVCDYVTWTVYPASGHSMEDVEAKKATYTNIGWSAHKKCSVCGTKEGYTELPKLAEPVIDNYEDFITNLALLEELAHVYVLNNPGRDPLDLVIKYIRSGVERYTTGSWGIMAGYEDVGFAKFVSEMVDQVNSSAESEDQLLRVIGLKNLIYFELPNGDVADFGHLFGTMDITYHNAGSVNHADVSGWAGDLVDLLSTTDRHFVSGTLDEMIADISDNYLCKGFAGESDLFTTKDMIGDLDGYYLMETIDSKNYVSGDLTSLMESYFTEDLTMEDRADFFLRNRLNGASLRESIRNAVYNAYTGNKVIATLEATRDFNSSDLSDLRRACCYAFADYLCRLAGDYVEITDNRYYTVFSAADTNLAPGITQQIKYATSADGKQMVYYIATADITRSDVHVFANYHDNDPAGGWAMQRVLDQANAAQNKYGNPDSELYIPNYNVIVSTNGSGYNMSTGEPGGLLVMGGVEYHPINSSGFFGIMKDGSAVIGTTAEYNTIYKDQIQEGIAAFGYTLIKNGKIVYDYEEGHENGRASRTAVGITSTGKVVMMVLDGRQEPFSCGGSIQEIAQIMLEAGCVNAVNLDGGGSTTYVAKQPGAEELSVINRPSDGFARSVSTSLLIVSTAPSSTAFDHADVSSNYNYMTVGASVQLTAKGISATGDAAEIPEGAYWAVSDDRWATISADGVLTALRMGSVEVKLMLGEDEIGSTTISIVAPDNLYFTRESVNAVYGQSVELPLKALFEGKEVAILASDVVFECSAAAGSINDFCFTAAENSTLKTTKIKASLAVDESISATITVALYNQGEVSFDFDQATGGDRQMAWDRVVSNSTTDDNLTYEIIEQGKDMVTTYSFAFDMTRIPIPQRLNDLIYMLPGADASNASAWGFLLQLAERISVLTEVTPVIRFDHNVDVDYSELKIVNDYFVLTGSSFDEAANTLTLTLNWIDQTAAIDPETANPLCIVSGIKLTPKADADWGSKNMLAIHNEGEIGYKVYMRASSLYSFAQKEENQQTFGLQPFVNPNDPNEKGGYFGDVYKRFADDYTLVNELKNGWIVEDGGFAYYVDGDKYTGINLVDGLYYDFGTTGINVGQTPYSGILVENGITFYAKNGEKVTGWHNIGEDWYMFDWVTGEGFHGTYIFNIQGVDVTYVFENGKLVKGFWYDDGEGIRYYYGPYYYNQGWRTIDGATYFFADYHIATGICPVRPAHATFDDWYEFTEDGKLIGQAPDGVHWHNGNLYYVVNGRSEHRGFYLVDGAYYYFMTNYTAVVGTTHWASMTNGLLPSGTYRFDSEGKVIMDEAIVNENGTLYFYRNGKRTTNAGLVKFEGDYYFIDGGAKAITNATQWVTKSASNGLWPENAYEFGADGKMIIYNGVVNGYYYVDGVRTAAGLVEQDGYYYFANNGGKLVVDQAYWVSKTNGLVSTGTYRFDAEGKMIRTTEVANENGTLYYYRDGKRISNAGLIEFEGAYYHIGDGAIATTNKAAWVVASASYSFAAGNYWFGADGKMDTSTTLRNENGTLYYYRNGKRTANAGLIEFEGDYYFIDGAAKAITNATQWVTKSASNGLWPENAYEFGADGKMIIYHGVANGYYYVDGIRTAAGLVEQDGYYYFANTGGKLVVDQPYWVSKTNGLVSTGTYRFDAEGKMITTTEVANENGTLYYYRDGKRTTNAGLIEFEGAYYHIGDGAIAATNKAAWVSASASHSFAAGNYWFGADGKMDTSTALRDENGTLFFYRNGKRTANAGLIVFEGNYYFIDGSAKAITNATQWVTKSASNGLVSEGSYTFGADGKMIVG